MEYKNNILICFRCVRQFKVDADVFTKYTNEGLTFYCSECKQLVDKMFEKEHSELLGKTTDTPVNDTRSYNVGSSDYAKHKIQPWDIWIEYKLNPFDADIVKRILRHKKGDSRKMDYEKIIHICQERIRQIDTGSDPYELQDVE